MKKLLFFACDPGGANALTPLFQPLTEQAELLIFGKGAALKKYQAAGFVGFDIEQHIKETSIVAMIDFLQQQSPDLLIAGTSANDMTEKYLWQAANQLGIPSLAILDQWVNYGIRFSKFGLQNITAFEKNRTIDFLPTKILVMDSYAKRQMIKEGVPREKILATGNPYFEQIVKSRKFFTPEKIRSLKKTLGVEKDLVLLFASEPLRLSYGDSKQYWGFSEEEILTSIIEAAEKLVQTEKRDLTLIIKLHPKESPQRYEQLLTSLGQRKIKIIVESYRSSLEMIMAADVVCGMFSMVLQEAAILKKPIISVAIGLKRNNIFVLENLGLIKSVLTNQRLAEQLESVLLRKQWPDLGLKINQRAISQVINVIKKYAKISY